MNTRLRLSRCLAVVLALVGAGAAAQDKAAERQARRLQLQLQSLQQQVQDAQAARAKVEADKVASDKQVAEKTQELGGLRGSLGKATAGLRSAEAARSDLAARLAAANAALEKQVAEQRRSSEETLAVRGRELAQFTRVRDEQVAQLQRQRDERSSQLAECSGKNERLVTLGAELLDRYRKKSVADVLKQQDPVLGLGDVQMFNLVQEYRDKADAERFTPPTTR